MATLTHVQSGRLYSWWWDSHISPKNSKWLQENLSDMDIKVKAMIKLIEEDADSFARRAEMYYKKRPELMKLVEEFYRAYRALAERYDHATGALRQAQRTITEAFPNQIPFLLPDESPLGSSDFEMEPPGPPRFKEGLQESDSEEKGGSDYQIICLQEEISRLLNDNQNLMDQALLESVRGDRAEAEVQSLKDTISKLVSEKEAALFQYQTSLDKISNLETEFSCMYKELKKHNDDMLVGLQEQICQLKEENGTLNEQNLSSGLSIKNLQGEVGLHEEEKQILHQKLSSLEENKIDLEDKHNGLTKQIEAVNSSVESLQALAKELKDENIELKELCKKHEVEKGLQLQHMDMISEKNAILENSLSERNNELELLREKIRALQELCESLHDKIYGHITEKAVLVSQIEVITQNTEKLSDKNIFLDKSLCEVNAELEGLRQTLKGLEDSFQLLLEQKNNLLGEKNALVNQVESVSQSLEIMEKTFAELEDKHLNLEKENRSTLLQVSELQNLLKSERKEHETLIRSSNNKLLALEKQIHILQEEGRLREEELIAEQYKAMNAHMENFIYQRCISDMKEKNLVFSTEWQKILEKSRYADELISKLEQEHLLLKEKGTILSKQNEKLREGLHQILEALTFGKNTGSSDGNKDESLLRLILCEIRAILNNIAETQDEKQNLLLEKSIIITVLKHFGLEMADLKLEKGFLEQESKVIVEELVVVQTKRNELQGINEQLKLELHSKNQNEELLKSETEIICQKLSDVREAYRILLEEHNSSSKKLYNMEVNKYALEKENTDILAKAMTLEHLYLIFKSYNAERVSDLKSLAGYLHSLHEVQNVLDRFIQMNNKLGALEIEIMNLKDPIINLDDDIEKASNQAKMNNELSVNKELVFSQADQMSQLLEARNTELHKEINDLKSREELLIFELKKGANELQKSELEFATILHDIQKAIVQATIFEEKVLELLTASKSIESGSLAQRELLKDEIASRNSRLDELKNRLSDIGAGNSRLKAKLDVYLPLILSLWKSIASLEKDTLSLAKHHTSMNQEDQIGYNYYETSEDCNATGLSGVLLLQKLHAKVEALRKVVADMGNLLEKERFVSNANLEATKKESVALDSEGRLVQQKLDSDHELQEDNVGSSKLNNNQITKDIPLDIVRTTPDRNDVSSPDAANDAKILELWEITEGHDSEHHNARATEAEKSNRATSKIVVEKELSINKLEASDKVKEPNQEWNKRILVTLASDAERLSLLQTSIGELKRKIELSGMPPSYEFEAIKEQTKEAEAAISDSVNVNNKLRKKAEIFSASTESLAGEFNEKGMGNTRRTQISERTRRESENIGMLEFEQQKIEYVLLKLEEEHKYNRERTSGKRWRVSLRDYLYGKRDGRRKGKAYFCVCLKPSSMFDCISCAK